MSDADRWNQRYLAGDTPWDTGRPSSELLRVLEEDKVPTGRAIDLGCGTGANAVLLAEVGFEVTAVDISAAAVDLVHCRKATAAVRVRHLLADVLDPPDDLGGPFDFVFDRGCYHAVRRTDVGRYLRTLERITAPGSVGLVLAGNAREKHEPGPPAVTEEEIREELGKRFEIVRLREFYFDQVEANGVRHLGWSCLLRRP